MNQEQLFPGICPDVRQAAVESDVDSAGGLQVVGHELGLSDDPVAAGKLLSNKINRNGRHRLTDEETLKIRHMARERAGRSRLHELDSASLNYEGKWLTSEDIKLRRKKRRAALLAELVQLDREDE